MKAKFGMIVTEGRGKIGGHVATRTKGGAAFRTKATPINPNTSFQTLQRSYQSDIAKAWPATLTDAQRKAWTSFGQQIGALNVFGDSMILAGIAAYQRINRIILNAGGTRLDNPPTTLDVPGILSLSLLADSSPATLSVTFTPTPLTTPEGLYIFATPALSPGISNVSNALRFIGFFDGATSVLDIKTEWIARFGTFPTAAGQRIAIFAHVVNKNTGAISAGAGTGTLVV